MTTPNAETPRWDIETLRAHLAAPLSDMIPDLGSLRLEFLCKPKAVADDASKLLVLDERGDRTAVVLISSQVEPELVSRGIERAKAIKSYLNPTLASVILDPIGTGTLADCSFAVLPYCKPMSKGRIGKRAHRIMLRPVVLEWLAQLAESTTTTPDEQQTLAGFVTPLEHLAANEIVGQPMTQAARTALSRLHAGTWKPRHIVTHGDLWEGNILFSNKQDRDPGNPFSRIVIIDWPGGLIEGYGIYDIIRLARSMYLPKHIMRPQLERHCQALGCDAQGARDHLVAALAHLGMHLGHFPPARYAKMGEECLGLLDRALDE